MRSAGCGILAISAMVACGRTAAPVPSWDDAGAPAASAPSASASVAPSASSVAASCPPYDPKELPEPVAPAVECVFRREVQCVPASPTLSAWQKWFPSCPKEGKAWADSMYPTKALFSAKETCAATADQCCYVQFVAGACR